MTDQQQTSGAARVAPTLTDFERGYAVAIERLAAQHYVSAAELLRKWGPNPMYWEQPNPAICPVCGEPSAGGPHAACADREAAR